MEIRVTTASGRWGTLTTKHPASSNGQPILVIEGRVYEPLDWIDGIPALLKRPHGRETHATAVVDAWNRAVVGGRVSTEAT